jgi:hypothetical protein
MRSEGESVVFSVTDGRKEIAAMNCPSGEVMGFGFAAAVRWKKNIAEIEVSMD